MKMEKGIFFKLFNKRDKLTDKSAAEAVKSSALSLKSIDNVESGDGLSLGVFSVGDCITDNSLEEGLEDCSGLFVDQSADTFDSSTTR